MHKRSAVVCRQWWRVDITTATTTTPMNLFTENLTFYRFLSQNATFRARQSTFIPLNDISFEKVLRLSVNEKIIECLHLRDKLWVCNFSLTRMKKQICSNWVILLRNKAVHVSWNTYGLCCAAEDFFSYTLFCSPSWSSRSPQIMCAIVLRSFNWKFPLFFAHKEEDLFNIMSSLFLSKTQTNVSSPKISYILTHKSLDEICDKRLLLL